MDVPARCVVLCVRRPWRVSSCSPVCLMVRRVVCAVSWATWPPFTGAPVLCVVLHVPCPERLGSCPAVCALPPLLCLCGVLGQLAPVHRCARLGCCVACAVSWETWLLFTGVRTPAIALRRPPGSSSPLCSLSVFCFVCRVIGSLAPVHRCACLVHCFWCAVSWATWLLFTGVHTQCVVLLVRCRGPLGSCSLVCSLSVLCRVLRVRGVAAGRTLEPQDGGCS